MDTILRKVILLMAAIGVACGCSCVPPNYTRIVCGSSFGGVLKITGLNGQCGERTECFATEITELIKGPSTVDTISETEFSRNCGASFRVDTEVIMFGNPRGNILDSVACGWPEYIDYMNATEKTRTINRFKQIARSCPN